MARLHNKIETTTCGSLLQELQKLWDEIGESDSERDKMLLQVEKECLDVYRRNVESTRKYKVDLHKELANAESEITSLVSALGEQVLFSLVSFLDTIVYFYSISSLVLKFKLSYFVGNGRVVGGSNLADTQVDEQDLTLKKLGEWKTHLQELQSEKSQRLQKVNGYVKSIHELSAVLSTDFVEAMNDVDPSIVESPNKQVKSVSNDTLARLAGVVHSLKQEKVERLKKLQDLATRLIELWNLLDTPVLEQKSFDHVTCLVSASVDEVLRKEGLALDVIEQTELEVERLNVIKGSKMKELILKKQAELEEIYRGVHMDVDTDMSRQMLINQIDSGNVDLSDLLLGMDDQINKAKEEAVSRKEILDKVEKWKFACEEESWLDDYERDQNRYSAGRGAHKNLKRAEKARILVSKIPCLMENLTAKVQTWEEEKGIPFLYDKVPLSETLREYTSARQEKDEDKRKFREKKRLQEQLATEQEALFGSRPSPIRPLIPKKPLGQSNNSNTMTPSGRHALHTPSSRRRESGKKLGAVMHENYVALPKE
ncbi:hypothetical protein IFM89_008409 [Coptis chinensis]|uniref:Uncharacterized protein n=1 Tax=Coptis chinensis TaxID=261450 RepID=A0A835LQW7_9MAGN|nr:hypothetical protein IFM89_008409 [Coptis chinensis]